MPAPVLSLAPARRSGVPAGSQPSGADAGARPSRADRPFRAAHLATWHPAGGRHGAGQRHATRRRWRLSRLSLIPALVMVVGLSALTYPHAAQWATQLRQSQLLSGYADSVAAAKPEREVQLDNARAYNAALTGGAIYEAGSNVPTSTGEELSTEGDASIVPYEDQLTANAQGLMARLRIPRIRLDLPIFHGTDDATLLNGLGHLRGTALPVGGEGMRPVITGHRGLAEAEMFTRLDELESGDTFTIEVFGEVLTYRIFEKIVVRPDEHKAFLAVPGRDLVTLVTCTPLGVNTHRILITGERVIPTPAAEVAKAGQRPDVPGFPWWLVAYLAGLGLVGLYVWWAGLPPKRRKPKDADAAASSAPSGPASATSGETPDVAAHRHPTAPDADGPGGPAVPEDWLPHAPSVSPDWASWPGGGEAPPPADAGPEGGGSRGSHESIRVAATPAAPSVPEVVSSGRVSAGSEKR